VKDELERTWKDTVVSSFKVLSRNCLEGLRNTTKNLSQDNWSQSRDLNPSALECEAGVSTTRLRYSVATFVN
jgi:hypothetical protein